MSAGCQSFGIGFFGDRLLFMHPLYKLFFSDILTNLQIIEAHINR